MLPSMVLTLSIYLIEDLSAIIPRTGFGKEKKGRRQVETSADLNPHLYQINAESPLSAISYRDFLATLNQDLDSPNPYAHETCIGTVEEWLVLALLKLGVRSELLDTVGSSYGHSSRCLLLGQTIEGSYMTAYWNTSDCEGGGPAEAFIDKVDNPLRTGPLEGIRMAVRL